MYNPSDDKNGRVWKPVEDTKLNGNTKASNPAPKAATKASTDKAAAPKPEVKAPEAKKKDEKASKPAPKASAKASTDKAAAPKPEAKAPEAPKKD
jgi:hypothetical protein